MYGKKTRPWDMASEFLNTVFLIALIVFSVFYFIVGDNFFLAQKIAKTIISFSWVGIIFVFKYKRIQVDLKKIDKEDRKNEIVAYFTFLDRMKDLVAIFAMSLSIYLTAFFTKTLYRQDFAQMYSVFFLMLIWHLYIFRKKIEYPDFLCATLGDKLKDEVLVFFLPVFMFGISFYYGYIDNTDIIQAFLVFVLAYFRHKKILFSQDVLK